LQSTGSPENEKRWTVGTLSYTKAGLIVLCFWMLWGDFATSLQERSVPKVVQLLFIRFHASNTLYVVFTTVLPALITLFVSPVISYNSDRHRGRWGRRIPFILFPVPLIVAAIIGMAFGPTLGIHLHHFLGSHSPGLDTSTLLLLGLFWVLYAFGGTVIGSVFGGLVNDVVPPEVLGKFFAMWRIIGLAAAIDFFWYLMGMAQARYFEIFLGLALLYGIGYSLMCFKVKEGNYPPPPEKAAKGEKGIVAFVDKTVIGIKTYFRECFMKPYYLAYFAAGITMGLMVSPVNWFDIPSANSFHLSMAGYGGCMVVTYSVSMVMAYPLGMLVDRFHPLPLTIIGVGIYGTCVFLGGLFIKDASTLAVFYVMHGIAAGIINTVSASNAQRILPRARFAELGSANGILGCICSIIFSFSIGFLLDHVVHNNYLYCYYLAAILCVVSLSLYAFVYRKFLALGGPKNYIAP